MGRSEDEDTFRFEFMIAQDVVSVMDTMFVAFRCNQSTGAALVVSSLAKPAFVQNEMVTAAKFNDMTRYTLVVSKDKAEGFLELLLADMEEANVQCKLARDSKMESLIRFLRAQMFWWSAVAAVELVTGVVIAALGLYLHALEGPGSNVALWGAIPLVLLFAYRVAAAGAKVWSSLSKLRQDDC